jgi:hypothetical protein
MKAVRMAPSILGGRHRARGSTWPWFPGSARAFSAPRLASTADRFELGVLGELEA